MRIKRKSGEVVDVAVARAKTEIRYEGAVVAPDAPLGKPKKKPAKKAAKKTAKKKANG